jgi:hypothetical protein
VKAALPCLLAVLLPAVAAAQDDDWGSGDDVGFGEVPDVKPMEGANRSASLTGFARSDWSTWVERLSDDPWAKGRQSLDLAFSWKGETLRVEADGHGEYDLAYLHDADRFDDATLETYQWRALPGRALVGASLGAVELTVGRQIVAWGEGDALSPLDVVNPRDNREPGLADLDDLRLAVAATRVGLFLGMHRLELMVIHESYFGERAPPMGHFSPLPSFLNSNPAAAVLLGGKTLRYAHKQDRFAADQQEFLGRWVYKGPGLDVGLYGASILDDQGTVSLPGIASLTSDDVDIPLDHQRYLVVGASGATTVDSFVIKAEVAGDLDRAYNTGDSQAAIPQLGEEKVNGVTGMVAITYQGVTDLVAAVEFQKSHVFDAPDDLLFPVDAPIGALRLTYTMLAERLRLLGALSGFGWTAENGWLARAEGTYEWADGLKTTLGYVHYGPGDDDELGPFSGLDEHDRVFARARYDFTLY